MIPDSLKVLLQLLFQLGGQRLVEGETAHEASCKMLRLNSLRNCLRIN